MPSVLAPRAVIVTRSTDLDLLIEEHGTRDQARFATQDRPGWFDEAVRRDRLAGIAVDAVLKALPLSWRRAHIGRDDLATFEFAPEDIVVPIGQDGLVANIAKYVDGQAVIGVNPDPENVAGSLVKFTHAEFGDALAAVVRGVADVEERTLVRARLDDGQEIHALNEVFVGHRSHQSARYRLRLGSREERQSSSGLIVATGTGAGGWARSISRERNVRLDLETSSQTLALFVREAFPAPGFGTDFTSALLESETLEVRSEMSEGGVIFGDGIEADFVRFGWGKAVEIQRARRSLHLVVKSRAQLASKIAYERRESA